MFSYQTIYFLRCQKTTWYERYWIYWWVQSYKWVMIRSYFTIFMVEYFLTSKKLTVKSLVIFHIWSILVSQSICFCFKNHKKWKKMSMKRKIFVFWKFPVFLLFHTAFSVRISTCLHGFLKLIQFKFT